jgi:hypothetical protein
MGVGPSQASRNRRTDIFRVLKMEVAFFSETLVSAHKTAVSQPKRPRSEDPAHVRIQRFWSWMAQPLYQWNYVGFEVLTAVVMKNTIFWDITPCSPLSVNRFGGIYRLHLPCRRIRRARLQSESSWKAELCFTLVSCSAYSSTLKIEAICSSETVDTQRTTRCYIPEDSTHH